MSFDWVVGFRQIARWIAAGTGLPNGAVVFTGQGGSLPKDDDEVVYPTWISVNMLTTRAIGEDQVSFGQNPLQLADDIVNAVDAALNTLTLTAHAYVTGDGPIRFTTTGVLPAGLALATDYWLVVVDVNTVKVVASRAAAVAAVPSAFVDITGAGTGVHTIVDTADTRRVLAEVKHVTEGHRIAVLSVQCFSDEATGTMRAQAVLERLRASRKLPGQQERLRDGRLAVSSIEPSTVIGGSASTASDLEPRAVMQVNLAYVDGAEEAGTTIESFDLEVSIDTDGDGDVDVIETFTVTRPA